MVFGGRGAQTIPGSAGHRLTAFPLSTRQVALPLDIDARIVLFFQ